MDYLSKVCNKDASDNYGNCYDLSTPGGDSNLPCRRYKYNHAICQCMYSNITNKFCSSEVISTDSHIMRIKYLE